MGSHVVAGRTSGVSCPVCGNWYVDHTNLQHHIRLRHHPHHANIARTQELPPASRLLSPEEVRNNPNPPVVCPICEQRYATNADLQRHIELRHQQQRQLDEHSRQHHSGSQHITPEAPARRHLVRSDAIRQLRPPSATPVQPGVPRPSSTYALQTPRPVSCPECRQMNATEQRLQQHMQIHRPSPQPPSPTRGITQYTVMRQDE